MALFFTTPSVISKNKNPKVVVIGAGLSGLTTAYRLQQKGVDVDIYEARNRVGGRVFTVNVGGNMAELGGQNITDGGAAENLHCLIKECGLDLTEGKVNLNLSYCAGQRLIPVQELLINKQFDLQMLADHLNELVVSSYNMHDVLRGVLEEEDHLYKVLSVRLAAYEGGSIQQLSPFYIKTLYHMLLGGICAAHQKDELKENYIDVVSIKGGNALLPEAMAEHLTNRLHLTKVLTHVAKDMDGSYLLTFDDGEKVHADILVLTNPCSTYGNIIFEENIIPLDRLNSIKSVQYGTNAKILIPISHCTAQKTSIINDCVIGWLDTARGLVTLYCTGHASLFSPDTIADTYRRDGSALVERGFAEVCSHLITPICAQDQAFSSYDKAVGHSWPQDPYAQGSYSYISPGQEMLLTELQEEKGEIVKTLFAPINQSLYFAGEHTSILMDVPGTMEAACESGERAARMILHELE